MGKKGAKRKTRWRTLSMGAPPGEEDEEDEVRNGYRNRSERSHQIQNPQENGTRSEEERNSHGAYKFRRPYQNSANSTYTSYGQNKSKKRDDTSSEPKIVFNEEEYTRITTPRQDVLFKKGYLSRKKPLVSTASTSATTTPSTIESQSASHSTADGSETTEDQQLLDAGTGTDYTSGLPVEAAPPQFAFGGFYDRTTGYYYEYPVMLVAPHPGNGANVLAAMPCGPVPLRPVEWFNPQFMQHPPEVEAEPVPEQCPVHATDSQGASPASSVSMEGSGQEAVKTAEASGTGSGEEETEKSAPEEAQATIASHLHVAHIPPPHHYLYPGHFMFGPPIVNVNGVTIQSGAVISSTEIASTDTKRRNKKKKRRKQRRPLATLGTTEDEEEGEEEEEEEEYSSEWEREPNCSTTTKPLNPEVQEFQLRTLPQSLPTNDDPKPEEDTSEESNVKSTVDTKVEKAPDAASSDRILPIVEDDLPIIVNKSEDSEEASSKTADINEPNKPIKNHLEELEADKNTLTNGHAVPLKIQSPEDEPVLLNSEKDAAVEIISADAITSITEEILNKNLSNVEEYEFIVAPLEVEKNPLANGVDRRNKIEENLPEEDQNGAEEETELESKRREKEAETMESKKPSRSKRESRRSRRGNQLTTSSTEKQTPGDSLTLEKPSSRPASPEINHTTTPINAEIHRLPPSYESLVTKSAPSPSPMIPPRRKYSGKGLKFVREATPGPDLDVDARSDKEDGKNEEDPVEVICEPSEAEPNLNRNPEEGSTSNDRMSQDLNEDLCQSLEMKEPEELVDSQEEPAIHSQMDPVKGETKEDNAHPITDAVTAWLRRANSPDIFVTSRSDLSETEEEDPDAEPSKNLQGSPMPALSASNCKASDGSSLASIVTNDKLSKIAASKESLSSPTKDRTGSEVEDPRRSRDNWEFAEEDTDAGMRVAKSSRVDLNKIEETTKNEPKNNNRKKKKIEQIEMSIRSVSPLKNVRTFERGEIVVSSTGKLLTGSDPVPETGSAAGSLGSIEEPDVLECWEAEVLEPIATRTGSEDLESRKHVEKYYRIAKSFAASYEEEPKEKITRETNRSNGNSPRSPERMIESLCSEEIPVISVEENNKQNGKSRRLKKLPVDEAFEAYESCYNVKATKHQGRKLTPIEGEEGQVPCKAVCCNIQ